MPDPVDPESGSPSGRAARVADSSLGSRPVTGLFSPPRADAPIEQYLGTTGSLTGTVLVVDDDEINRMVLSGRLQQLGLTVRQANDGVQALAAIQEEAPDLMCLDVQMPELDGFGVLEAMRADPKMSRIPVLVISAIDEIETVVRCIELGAEDYLPKPFNRVLLSARVRACIERKRMRDREQEHLRSIEQEKARSEALLLNILPAPIANRLKAGEAGIAHQHDDVAILFADLVGFTALSEGLGPRKLVGLLNALFSVFDRLTDELGLEKIKTIGDAYLVVGGLPEPMGDNVEAVARLALRMREAIPAVNKEWGVALSVRMGIHVGPVVAGVIGQRKFTYDIWGDTVNTAARMEAHSVPGFIQVSEPVAARLQGMFELQSRGVMPIKGKGNMPTWFLLGETTARADAAPGAAPTLT